MAIQASCTRTESASGLHDRTASRMSLASFCMPRARLSDVSALSASNKFSLQTTALFVCFISLHVRAVDGESIFDKTNRQIVNVEIDSLLQRLVRKADDGKSAT